MSRKVLFPILLLIMVFPGIADEFPGLETLTLDNGMELMVYENHNAPLVRIQISFRCGARTQTRENAGLFHLYEHMLFKGNERYPTQTEFSSALKSLGVSEWNGGTSYEYVTYYFTIPSSKIREGIEFWSNAVRKPLLTQEELETEKEVVVNEIRGYINHPDQIFQSAIHQKLYHSYPWRRDISGSELNILNADVDDMQYIKDHYYTPDNAILLVGGDITVDQAVDYTEEFFGDWVQPNTDRPEFPPHPAVNEDSYLVYSDEGMYNGIILATLQLRGPDVLNDPESTYAADIWLKHMNNPDSRFKQAVFDTVPGLYSKDHIYSVYVTQRDGGYILFQTYMYVLPGEDSFKRLAAFKDAVFSEVQLMSENPDYFPADDYSLIKTMLEDEQTLSMETTDGFLSNISFWWSSANTEYFFNYVDNMVNVDHQDIKRFLDTYINGKKSVLAVRMNEDNFMGEITNALLGGFEIIKEEDAYGWQEQ